MSFRLVRNLGTSRTDFLKNVREFEIREIFHDAPRYRFLESGKIKGEHLYLALGVTDTGRYLSVFFIYKKNRNALIATARDMTDKERKRYAKK